MPKKFFVTDRYKVIVFPIPKNASTSFRGIVCGKNEGIQTIELWNYNLDDYIKLAIIRNPLERFISAYCTVIRFEYKINNIEDFNWSKKKLIDNIERTIKVVEDKGVFGGRGVNEHLVSQVFSLSSAYNYDKYKRNDIVPIDKFIIFEDLDNEWERIKNDVKLKDRKLNMSMESIPFLKAIVSSYVFSNLELIKTINKVYEQDWELYNSILDKKLKEYQNDSK